MDLRESDEFVEKLEKNNKRKKILLILMGICFVAIVFLFLVMQYYIKIDEKTLKLKIDGKETEFSSSFIKTDNEKKYYNVKQLCSMLGYTYNQGEYKSYTEDAEMCYVTNDYAIVSFGKNSEFIIKYLTKKPKNDTETDSTNEFFVKTEEFESKIKLTNKILCFDEGIYVSTDDIENIFDINVDDQSEYRIYFQSAKKTLDEILPKLSSKGYKSVSDYYENLIAIPDGMVVVSNGEKFGVLSIMNGYNEIIGMKYDDIIYMQSTNEFIVTAENYQGIVSVNGNTIVKPTLYECISPMYDMIYVNDEGENCIYKLYIVEKNNKFGVINSKNQVIVSTEYNSIGIDNNANFAEDNITNTNILFDLLIPVKFDEKYGLVDINGNERLECIYDSIGYIAENNDSEKEKNEETNTDESSNKFDSLLTIPEETGIKGIIVKRDGLYGIYDVNRESLTIPCVFEKIYSKTKLTTKKYYIQYNGKEIELESYLEENNLKSVE